MVKKKPEIDRWKPVLRGGVYCSPACGGGVQFGCTKQNYDKSTSDAERLAQRMGTGWTPRVWENLGWHYCVNSPNGCIKVYPSIHKGIVIGYSALMGDSDSVAGTFVEHSTKSPEEAIKKVNATAKKKLIQIIAMYFDVSLAQASVALKKLPQ
jgi:hypothetical protein